MRANKDLAAETVALLHKYVPADGRVWDVIALSEMTGLSTHRIWRYAEAAGLGSFTKLTGGQRKRFLYRMPEGAVFKRFV